jgi:hypothetical protein
MLSRLENVPILNLKFEIFEISGVPMRSDHHESSLGISSNNPYSTGISCLGCIASQKEKHKK